MFGAVRQPHAQKFLASVVRQSKSRKISFSSVNFFWADERCLPPTDLKATSRPANDLLLTPLKISEKQIPPLARRRRSDLAAKQAEAEIHNWLAQWREASRSAILIFLGNLGEDGHVASLFPGEPESWVSDKAVYRAIQQFPQTSAESPHSWISNPRRSAKVWMLASGSGKEQAFREYCRR